MKKFIFLSISLLVSIHVVKLQGMNNTPEEFTSDEQGLLQVLIDIRKFKHLEQYCNGRFYDEVVESHKSLINEMRLLASHIPTEKLEIIADKAEQMFPDKSEIKY